MIEARTPAIEVVHVVDEERVAPRGTACINWFVRVNDAWVHASEWPGGVSERLDAHAGTVWQSRTELRVPRGTRLMCVQSRPAAYPDTSPLEYLTRGKSRPGREVVRRTYAVGRNGRLILESD